MKQQILRNNSVVAKVKCGAKPTRGQGMTEYIIIVALVAMVSIGVVTAFGRNIQGLFMASTNTLVDGEAQVDDYVEKFDGETDKTLSNFAEP